jgi:uncharacterized membrane protein
MVGDKTVVANTLPRVNRPGGTRVEAEVARRLATAFVLYGLVATAFLAINVPPFQNPDEFAHFLRAAQIADGSVVGSRFWMTEADGTPNLTAGGRVDPALVATYFRFNALGLNPDTRATRSLWSPPFCWSEAREMGIFPNSVLYPPFFYAPSAIGILVGHVARMTVTQTLVLSRLLTGVVAVATGAAAIACAGGAAAWLFMVLTLPISLSLIASSSQDALLLTCGALAGALLERMSRWPAEQNGKMLVGLTVTLSLVAMARPPYVALALLPLGLPMVRARWRILSAVAIVASVVVWSWIAWASVLTNFGKFVGADPGAQAARLLADPLMVVHVAWATLALHWRNYLTEFVGQLGWLDTALPTAYHVAARIMMGMAAVAAMLGTIGARLSVRGRLMISLASLLSILGVFGSQYLAWTVPGGETVEGVQGRYFLPIAVVGAGLLPAFGNRWCSRFRDPLLVVVAGFPVITLAVVMRAILVRYYLG